MKRYYRRHRNSRWSFYAARKDGNGKMEFRDVQKAGWTHIVRHVKIQADANPFDPVWNDYFRNRKKRTVNQNGYFAEECGWLLD